MHASDYKPPRWTAVPWLDTLADLRAFGPVETTVEHGSDVTLGLLIPDPFGKNTTAMLSIRATDWRSGDVTLAITNVLSFDAGPVKERPAMDLGLLSNPVRKEFPDDNGCNTEGD
jgi:hypothetical protein